MLAFCLLRNIRKLQKYISFNENEMDENLGTVVRSKIGCWEEEKKKKLTH